MQNLFKFKNIEAFYLLFLIPILILVYVLVERRSKSGYLYSNTSFFKEHKSSLITVIAHLSIVLFLIGLVFLIIALARPQKVTTSKDIETYGVDIVIAFDISTSMKAIDFKPKNRFFVARDVIGKFIKKRKNDRISLVVFAGEAFTKCPLTIDKRMLIKMLYSVKMGVLKDGTAIGDALGLSVKRLLKSKAKSKIIILVTDGDNNSGVIEPGVAAEIAKENGIKVYTIGVGTKGGGLVPVGKDMFGNIQYAKTGEIDEGLLMKIAEKTNGIYQRARSKKELQEIYDYIDKNEKSVIKIKNYRYVTEQFYLYLLIGAVFAGLGFLVNLLIKRVE